MRVRIVISGVIAGAMCFVPLWFQYYWIEASKIVPGWSTITQFRIPDSKISNTIVYLFCGVTLFTFGWVSARWNWSESRRSSTLAGSGTGVIAGCLIYDFIGAFWFSIKGQENVLGNFYNTISEADGTRIFLEAIPKTGVSLYSSFVEVVLVCTLLSALGGFASSVVDAKDQWGNDPRKPQGWLFRLSAYLLTVFGFLNTILTQGVFAVLSEAFINSTIRASEEFDIQWSQDFSLAFMFNSIIYLTGALLALIPAGITWGLIIRSWLAKGKPNISGTLWIIITTVIVSYVFFNSYNLATGISFFLPVILLALAFIVGILAGLATGHNPEEVHYRFTDWLGYGLTSGILGGTQIIMGILEYLLVFVLITIPNMPHLTATGIAEQTPPAQVIELFKIQSASAGILILGNFIIALLVAGLVALMRLIFGIREEIIHSTTGSSG